jgi:hypothetical protein
MSTMKKKTTELVVSRGGWDARWLVSLRWDWVGGPAYRPTHFPSWVIPIEYEVWFDHSHAQHWRRGVAVADWTMESVARLSRASILKIVKAVLNMVSPYSTANHASEVLSHVLGCLLSAALRMDEHLRCAGEAAQEACESDHDRWSEVVNLVRDEQGSPRS